MFVSLVIEIEKDWIDYNGHLNMAYYNVIFDRAGEDAFVQLGLGGGYARARGLTTYAAEAHVCYIRELHFGHSVTVTLQLLDYDQKRLHVYQELRHIDGWLAATSEQLCLHVDMSGPKVVPFPPDILANLERMHASHAMLGVPVRAGRAIAIKRNPRA
ncbi:thioesterase family protein [Allomesorhizobium camelthorni]|uniref:Thioesterase n=1 Tax=Allomesorhizobium camelthorni TaxID=475069 RepID=A0A6G4WLN1_9HYPH|nr:thioesterase family protein [Mesorhizobium camelthorni]NGO55509.1 thioesterase [Mesorhizobium camelthorni]